MHLIPDSQTERFFLPTWPKNPIWLPCMTKILSKHFYFHKSFTHIMTERLIYVGFWFHFLCKENIAIAKWCFFNISRISIKICNGEAACDACLVHLSKETGKYWDQTSSTHWTSDPWFNMLLNQGGALRALTLHHVSGFVFSAEKSLSVTGVSHQVPILVLAANHRVTQLNKRCYSDDTSGCVRGERHKSTAA